MMVRAVALPMSAASSTVSSSVSDVSSISRVSASTDPIDSVNESRVRVTACFMRSKKPRFSVNASLVEDSPALSFSFSASESVPRLPNKEKTILFLV